MTLQIVVVDFEVNVEVFVPLEAEVLLLVEPVLHFRAFLLDAFVVLLAILVCHANAGLQLDDLFGANRRLGSHEELVFSGLKGIVQLIKKSSLVGGAVHLDAFVEGKNSSLEPKVFEENALFTSQPRP